jgi:hypothetical protein
MNVEGGIIMAYFANGSEGMYLDIQCHLCPIPYNAPCPILAVQFNYNYEQFDKDGKKTKLSEAMNMLVNDKGDCQMKPILDELKGG